MGGFIIFTFMKIYHLLRAACFLTLLCACTLAFGQKKKKDKKTFERSPSQELVYASKSYLPAIKTVQFYPIGKESRLPVYGLGSADQLFLSFDDLRADVRNYYISIEHCNIDWTPSRASVLDYVQGFNEDRIEDYSASMGTLQHYTNYSLTFPTANIKPKLAGNYLLKVYEDADKSRLILTQRFYVLSNLVNISSTIQQSSQVALRTQNQKLNITLKTGLTINNPQRDLQVIVKQNQRPDNQMQVQTPSFVAANEFRYNNPETFDFKGNNEFRYIDIRSFRFASDGVSHVNIDSIAQITAQVDEDKRGQSYGGTFDENGRFYIRNRDHEDQPTMCDYAKVTFSLKADAQQDGKIYIVGGFNDYVRSSENLLTYNSELGLWQVTLLLKQGLYDYDYAFEDAHGKLQTDRFSGSYFQTGNDYQLLIYNRRMGTYWDELVGYSETSIHNKHN